MEFYRNIISPILDKLDSETMHVMARDALHLAEHNGLSLKLLEQFSYGRKRFTNPRLETTVGGIKLDNPIMVGAGWDKKGVAVRALYTLGFSAPEIGSVLLDPQPGNPKKRQFYDKRGVALNRLGFNSPGVKEVITNLCGYKSPDVPPIGISLGKNKDVTPENAPRAHADVVNAFSSAIRFGQFDIAYYTINVSSPNTPGLRKLQDKKPLTDIIQAVNETMKRNNQQKPLFVKIAPDLEYTAIDDVIEVAVDNGLAGIVACNTAIDTDLKRKYFWGAEAGGLSGNDPDYRNKVDRIIAHIYREAGDKLDIIGVGGVNDYNSTISKIGAGAKAVQVVTAIREIGPTLPGRINMELVNMFDDMGIENLSECVGQEAHAIPH